MMKYKKGFGEVASTLIMFIAVLGVTIGVVISFQNFVIDTQGSFEDQQELTSNKLKTAISISNTYYNDSSQRLYVYVKNIGGVSLNTEIFDIYVDGQFQDSFDVVSPTNFSNTLEILPVQDTLTMIVNKTLSQGTHNVRVVTEFGVSEEDSFNT